MLQPYQQLGQWDEAADLVRKYDKARMEKIGECCYGGGGEEEGKGGEGGRETQWS